MSKKTQETLEEYCGEYWGINKVHRLNQDVQRETDEVQYVDKHVHYLWLILMFEMIY